MQIRNFLKKVYANIGLLILMEAVLLVYDVLALTFNFEEAKAVVEMMSGV